LPSDLSGGLALHRGEVAYGNIGAAARLDFTVIGAAVNLASRLEGLCGRLGVPWLVSDAVAAHVREPLADLGEHALKGVPKPVRAWGPAEPQA
jgi:class 3 adenylate cyclase